MQLERRVRGAHARGLVTEIAVIVVGVLIALGAGQVVETWNWQHKVAVGEQQLLQEARTARLPAGQGELPLYDFLDALPPGLEIEYEVARLDLADRPALEKAQAAHEDARRFMDAYAQHRQRLAAALGD